MPERKAGVRRETSETTVSLEVNIDGSGAHDIETGIPFYDHMLGHVARHGMLDLTISAKGDIEVDYHHLVEDVGIVLGQALNEALGDKAGIARYGTAFVPMDEALVMVAVDFSGRPHLSCDLDIVRPKAGQFDSELGEVFFSAVAGHGKLTLHVRQMAGANSHHILEAAFKAFGRAIGKAAALDPRRNDVPSTKGSL